MIFSSYSFVLAFLPLVLAGVAVLQPLGRRVLLVFLILASLVFYGWWNWHYLWVPLASIAFNYAAGHLIVTARDGGRARRAAWIAGLGVAGNLAFLAVFKYGLFAVSNANWAFGASMGWWQIALPLGISFFTFQQIAYLIDLKRGDVESHDLVGYMLFVTFFPQLIAGPIVHHREMMPQFESGRAGRLDADLAARGLAIFVLGLAKKVLIADHVSGYVGPVFDAAEAGVAVPLLEAWAGALSYSFQIYFDFSAYCDMAIGLGLMFGVRLPINFFSPYKATGPIEFWRRWHITLSRFLRDYLYFPLGGNRKGPARRYANLMIVMVLGGLWHGAGWTFVLWGLLHGGALALNHLWRSLRGVEAPARGWMRPPSVLACFLFVTVAWVFFRAGSMEGAVAMLTGMVGGHGVVLPVSYAGHLGPLADLFTGWGGRFEEVWLHQGSSQALWLAGLAAIAWFLPNTLQWASYDPDPAAGEAVPAGRWRLLAWRPSVPWAVALSLLGLVCLVFMSRTGEFLYFRF